MVNRRRSGAFQPLLEENGLGRISLATKETDIIHYRYILPAKLIISEQNWQRREFGFWSKDTKPTLLGILIAVFCLLWQLCVCFRTIRCYSLLSLGSKEIGEKGVSF